MIPNPQLAEVCDNAMIFVGRSLSIEASKFEGQLFKSK